MPGKTAIAQRPVDHLGATVPAGHQVELRLVSPFSGNRNVIVAYDTTGQGSRVKLP